MRNGRSRPRARSGPPLRAVWHGRLAREEGTRRGGAASGGAARAAEGGGGCTQRGMTCNVVPRLSADSRGNARGGAAAGYRADPAGSAIRGRRRTRHGAAPAGASGGTWRGPPEPLRQMRRDCRVLPASGHICTCAGGVTCALAAAIVIRRVRSNGRFKKFPTGHRTPHNSAAAASAIH